MLTFLSLDLGLMAWGLGAAAIVTKGKPGLMVTSFTACGISLVLQFYEITHQVAEKDWSWMLDVCDTLADVAAILLVVTVVLNFAALWHGRRR